MIGGYQLLDLSKYVVPYNYEFGSWELSITDNAKYIHDVLSTNKPILVQNLILKDNISKILVNNVLCSKYLDVDEQERIELTGFLSDINNFVPFSVLRIISYSGGFTIQVINSCDL